MLEQYLGDERFRQGVSHYLDRTRLRQHRDQRPVGRDRGDHAASPVRQLMDSWIWQPGYPLVDRVARRHRRSCSRQQRFAFGDTDDATTWLVPVHVRSGDESQRVLLDGRDRRVLALADPSAPVVVNAGGQRVLPRRLRRRAARPARGATLDSLDTLERYNLVDDAWNAVVAGRLDGATFLSFVEGFAAERELAVWQAIVLGLRGLGRLLDDADYPRFQARVAALVAPVVADLGDPAAGEDDLTGKLRGTLDGDARRARRRRRRPWRAAASATRPSRRGDVGRSRAGRRGHRRWWPRPATPTTTSGCSTATAPPRRRRTSSATSTRSPSSTTRRSCCARASCA